MLSVSTTQLHQKAIDITGMPTLMQSGMFEVFVDGKLIHSKNAGQGFPDTKIESSVDCDLAMIECSYWLIVDDVLCDKATTKSIRLIESYMVVSRQS
ncbi:unnamed protein product [Rotaria socialis]|uniref:Uncharacterized protein n=1 Tax=Rotaria socialis TaxID=392032 RepID=A0A818AV43_9BILA|nr:unnamed protein product [Rotaria socialis]